MAYTATVTSPMRSAERFGNGYGFFAGKCDITLYDTTLVTITGITKYFGTSTGTCAGKLVAVIPTGVSDNGHVFQWDYTTGAFKCYKPSNVIIAGSNDGAAMSIKAAGVLLADSTAGSVVAVAVEAAAVNVGTVGFIAIGFM